MVEGSNPIINSSTIYNHYNFDSDGLSLNDANQKFAISIYGDDWSTKYDPKYVRLLANIVTKDKDNKQKYQTLELHSCTEEDW